MKQQQAQVQGAHVPILSELIIELLAMRNFEARNVRRDRAWSRDQIESGSPALLLSELERSEFIEQARYQLQKRRGF
jgi:hypothetical protein